MGRRSVLGLLGGGLAARGAPARAGRTSTAEVVDAAFRPLAAAHDVPGMAVAVTDRGRRSFFHYGVASREDGAPVTQETLFEIGSLSKTFTATLATYAQALGRLSLADPPGRHVPALRGSALDRATLLHLGTYTAGGLPLQFPDDVATPAAASDYFRRFQPVAAPGAQRRYSNPSIGLLGHATAQALGGEFVALCEAGLYRQLGLRQTWLHVPAARLPHYAWGHDRADRPIRVNPGVFDAQAYGVKSTAADMLRFVEANLAPQGLPPAWRRAVEDTHVGHFQVGGMVQGLGWEQHPWPVGLDRLLAGNASTMALEPQPARALAPPRAPDGGTLFNKTGSTNGFGAYAAFVPQRQLGIVLLANRNIPVPARVSAAHAVLQAMDEAR
ncbi:class C beta-lactamase [Ramlibacter sp.]|uniref:class C beta-lactamase n=1 Tax=Ramlibacter sp. TaxID=1917967 RepID=UPI0039C96759